MQGPNQTYFLTLRGFLLGAPTLKGPILTAFLILRRKSNFINEFRVINVTQKDTEIISYLTSF